VIAKTYFKFCCGGTYILQFAFIARGQVNNVSVVVEPTYCNLHLLHEAKSVVVEPTYCNLHLLHEAKSVYFYIYIYIEIYLVKKC